jgi:hypothetical protein
MSTETTTETDAQRYGREIAESLHNLDAASEAYTGGDVDPFTEWLALDVLEIVVYLAATDPDPSSRRAIVEVLVTYGGPTCWVVRDCDRGENVEVRTSWGSDQDTRRVWVPTLAALLDEFADTYRQATR